MSKICLFTDNHFCEHSSIVIKQGNRFSVRLENQIKSIEWVEALAETNGCESVICLGDFFDKAVITDHEAEAFMAIKWSKSLKHIFIVGNHESHQDGLTYSTTRLLECVPNSQVFNTPTQIGHLCFLPYITESSRESLSYYFEDVPNKIIFSHNDLAGIQMGPVISKTGFNIDEIEDECSLFLNGHLHNGRWITKKILNLGNLTGKDFGEDANLYHHGAFILDTESLEIEYVENPYAFNFYQFDIKTIADIDKLSDILDNAVLSIKCKTSLNKLVRDKLDSIANKLVATRIINSIEVINSNVTELDVKELSLSNYLPEYSNLCKSKLENTDVLLFELSEVCK